MTESKKQIEDAVWNYIASRRPLKLAAIAVSAIGIVAGAMSALEKPAAFVTSGVVYLFGVYPPIETIAQERNGFVVGRLLYEAQIAAGDGERLRKLFDVMEGSIKAVGYTGTPLGEIQGMEQRQARELLSRFQESFSGHLQSRGGASWRFFLAGRALTKLEYAFRLINSPSEIKEAEDDLRVQIKEAQRLIAYRIPHPQLLPAEDSQKDLRKYDASLQSTVKAMHAYLGLPEVIDPIKHEERVRP